MILDPEKSVQVDRPDHINYFLGLAVAVSQRSNDSQTRHGCVITTKDYRIIGTGYNGTPRDCDISLFPNVRPEKYPFFVHSEVNALTNCIRPPKEVGGGIAFVTGRCCYQCTQLLWQNHVEEIYQVDEHCWYANTEEKEKELKEYLVAVTGEKLKLHYVQRDLSWMENLHRFGPEGV